MQKSKSFLILATFFAAPIDAFDDIYLRCAGGTVFIGVVQSLRDRLQGNGAVTVKVATRDSNGLEGKGDPGGAYTNRIMWGNNYIDRVSGVFYKGTNPCFKIKDQYESLSCILEDPPLDYERVGSCEPISKEAAISGAKRIYSPKVTKRKF